jgi:glycosyltransferase involved in cell wall biosynthesis
MQSSSVFVLPTRIDTGPTALKEALAMGLWPVCYDNSGPSHYIRKFQYGNLAEDLNLPALTEALRQAIAAQEWKSSASHEKVKSHIRPHFDRSRIWRELINVYGKICQS